MKTGITAYYINRYGLNDGLARMKKHGFSHLDYQGFLHTEDELFQMEKEDFTKTLTKIRKTAEDNGITFYQCHAPWRCPPIESDKSEIRERTEQMKKAVFGTHLLGGKCFVIHPLMPFGTEENPDENAFIKINRMFLSELCGYAKPLSVTVCLENMPFSALPLSKPKEIISFVRDLNIDNLKICLDTGHCNVFGISPADAVREIGSELLFAIHVHDNNGEKDLHWPVFQGTTDWEDFRSALKEVGFEGSFSLETSVPDSIPDEIREYREIGLADAARYLAN